MPPTDKQENQPDLTAGAHSEPIPTYMSQAVLATILCFPFTGLMGIVYASQVTSKLQAGDVEGAKEASRKARRMVWLSVILGIVMIVVTVAVLLALAFYAIVALETIETAI